MYLVTCSVEKSSIDEYDTLACNTDTFFQINGREPLEEEMIMTADNTILNDNMFSPDLEEGETEGLADPVEQSSDEKPKDDDSSNDSDEG